jgi:hypothetical protein
MLAAVRFNFGLRRRKFNSGKPAKVALVAMMRTFSVSSSARLRDN